MIICAGNNETFDFATPMGVGLIDTAMNVTRLCLFDKPEFLLFVGTAGSYGSAKVMDVIASKTAANIELSFLQKYSYTPINNIISAQIEDKKDVIVNSSNYITTDALLASRFETLGIGLENMEFFSVLRVAQEFGISAGGIFCVTNYCNENAHEDFIKNHHAAKAKLTEYIKERF
jgi:nucleoside phosphorylase